MLLLGGRRPITEQTLAGHPTLCVLHPLGYVYLPSADAAALRDGPNHVLLRPSLVESNERVNKTSKDVAEVVDAELQGITDNNEGWLQFLRGNYSRQIPGGSEHQTSRLIGFPDVYNNTFTVTNKLKVRGAADRLGIVGIVVYVNWIPLVVIEAKSPLAANDKAREAFERVRQYEREIPRLYCSKAFNVITSEVRTPYGPSGTALD